MADNEKKRKTVTIGVDDMHNVFQRYSESTVITLYQEITKFCGEKIEWKELVKRTSTGIKNAREYQMLWRHLAYRHPLLDNIEDGAEPLDDESDLETELEATPPVSAKYLADAKACVKVLLACGSPNDSMMPDNLAGNENLMHATLPNSHCALSRPGSDSSLHVSPKRPSCALESSNDFGVSNPLSKKKRHMWSSEDDKALIAGVKKCGVGNWATISRELFNGERNATQVSSRWKILRDKNNLGSNSMGSNVKGQQLSNELETIATRNAISMALKMPVHLTASSVGTASVNQLSQVGSSQPQMDWARTAKPNVALKSSISSDSMLLATAVAAGARIATPEAAESLLKVAHANNAVHIMHGGGSIKKSASFSRTPTSHLVAPHHNAAEFPLKMPSNSSEAVPSTLKVSPPITCALSDVISSTSAKAQ